MRLRDGFDEDVCKALKWTSENPAYLDTALVWVDGRMLVEYNVKYCVEYYVEYYIEYNVEYNVEYYISIMSSIVSSYNLPYDTRGS